MLRRFFHQPGGGRVRRCGGITQEGGGNYKALLIGINYTGQEHGELKECHNNVAQMREYIVEHVRRMGDEMNPRAVFCPLDVDEILIRRGDGCLSVSILSASYDLVFLYDVFQSNYPNVLRGNTMISYYIPLSCRDFPPR